MWTISSSFNERFIKCYLIDVAIIYLCECWVLSEWLKSQAIKKKLKCSQAIVILWYAASSGVSGLEYGTLSLSDWQTWMISIDGHWFKQNKHLIQSILDV